MRVKAMRIAVVIGLVLTGAALVGASCGDSKQPDRPEAPRAVERPTPTLRLAVITDIKGYLEPCGCTSRPLGGIDRMAAKVEALRADGVPTVLVAAGDLFFGNEQHGVSVAGAETQEIWKAEVLIEIFDRLGLAAATPGHLDFAFGSDTFAELARRADFPLLAAGLSFELPPQTEGGGAGEGATEGAGDDPPAPVQAFRATHLETVGDVKVGFLGVSVLEGADGALPAAVTRTAELREAARAAASELERAGADLVVALVRGTRRDARQIAAGVPGVDFVVQAGLDLEEAIPPIAVDGAFLVHGGRQGQGLLVLDVYRRDDGPFTDWSDWTNAVERERVEARIEELRARIAEWEGDDSVSATDLEAQKSRLARMERERDALRVPAEIEGNAFAASWAELAPEAPQKPEITRLMSAYDRRVNENNRRIFADLAPAPAPAGAPHYVGSQACAGSSCHQAAFEWWMNHPHGRAYATLVERHKQFNLSCVGCHVTGYMKPGGSTVTHLRDGALENVGCESCHGPGSAHVARPSEPSLVARDAPAALCVTCHNEEHSDTFVYEGYRAMLIVPGHGRPLL